MGRNNAPPLRGNGVWEGSGERPLKLPRTVRQGSCFDCPGGTHPYLWPELLEPEDHSSCSTISARREQILMGLEGCTSRWLKYPGEEGRNWINIMAVRKDKEILSPARQIRQMALIFHTSSFCPNSTHNVEQNQESQTPRDGSFPRDTAAI